MEAMLWGWVGGTSMALFGIAWHVPVLMFWQLVSERAGCVYTGILHDGVSSPTKLIDFRGVGQGKTRGLAGICVVAWLYIN